MIVPPFKDTTIRSVISDITSNFPECAQSYACETWKYNDLRFSFRDLEDGKVHVVQEPELRKAFGLMFTKMDGKMPCAPPCPTSDDEDKWESWLCNADANTFDAFIQLAIEGDVIYG